MKRSRRIGKLDVAIAENASLAAQARFLESERETALARAVTAERERDEQTENYRAAVADRSLLLAMLRSDEGRAQAAVLVRLLTPAAQPEEMALRWNAAMARWEDMAAVERWRDAQTREIKENYQEQIDAIEAAQRQIRESLAAREALLTRRRKPVKPKKAGAR